MPKINQFHDIIKERKQAAKDLIRSNKPVISEEKKEKKVLAKEAFLERFYYAYVMTTPSFLFNMYGHCRIFMLIYAYFLIF